MSKRHKRGTATCVENVHHTLSCSPAELVVGERIFTDDQPRKRPTHALPPHGKLAFCLISCLYGRPHWSRKHHLPERTTNNLRDPFILQNLPGTYGAVRAPPPEHPYTRRKICDSLWFHPVPPSTSTARCFVEAKQCGAFSKIHSHDWPPNQSRSPAEMPGSGETSHARGHTNTHTHTHTHTHTLLPHLRKGSVWEAGILSRTADKSGGK